MRRLKLTGKIQRLDLSATSSPTSIFNINNTACVWGYVLNVSIIFQYCKFYMVKFCPHDLFVNTRADLGACVKVHDDEAKKLFEQAKSRRKIAYQEEFIRFCTSMLNDVERKIIKGKNDLAIDSNNFSFLLLR